MDTGSHSANPLKLKEAFSIQESLLRLFAYLLIAALSLFIAVATLSNYFPDTIGIHFRGLILHDEGGVYADCSLRKNARNPICLRRERMTQRDRDWSDIKRSGGAQPFSLSD